MTSDDRFKPPLAAVADLDIATGLPRGLKWALAFATAAQLGMYGAWSARFYVLMVSDAVLMPLSFVAVMAGFACLYIGIVLLVATRTWGARFLMASVVLQVLGFALGHFFFLQPTHLSGFVVIVLPILLGVAIATWGWVVASARGRATPTPKRATGEPA